MTDRPTPEELADEFHYDSPLAFLRHLHDNGYVIVHPDDFDTEVIWREDIFGDTQ